MSAPVQIVGPDQVSWEDLRDIRLQALRSDPQAFGMSEEEELQTSDQEWHERLTRSQSGMNNHIFFARSGGTIVGMVGAYIESRPKLKHIANVWGAYVRSDYRGRGVGRMLLETLLRELENREDIEKIKLSVTVDQEQARRLYERLGFRVVGRLERELKVGEKYYDEFLMEKHVK